jgi:AcrR family transcriptional regulator
MQGDPLARTRILKEAAAVLRRHGPAKLTVVEVAKRLGMSHANIYRFFASKEVLRAAVAADWLDEVMAPLIPIALGEAPAPERFGGFLRTLADIKRRKVLDDPEMFAGFHHVVTETPDLITQHLRTLRSELAVILSAGLSEGSLPGVGRAEQDAQAVLTATARWHHPELVQRHGFDAAAMAELDRVIELLLRGFGHSG